MAIATIAVRRPEVPLPRTPRSAGDVLSLLGRSRQARADDRGTAGSEPFKLDYPPLPPLPQLLDSISKWAAPLPLMPGARPEILNE